MLWDLTILRKLAFLRFIQTAINRQIFSLILPSTISERLTVEYHDRIKIFLNFTEMKHRKRQMKDEILLDNSTELAIRFFLSSSVLRNAKKNCASIYLRDIDEIIHENLSVFLYLIVNVCKWQRILKNAMLHGITRRTLAYYAQRLPLTAIKDLLIKVQTIFHKVPTFSSRLFVIQNEKLN